MNSAFGVDHGFSPVSKLTKKREKEYVTAGIATGAVGTGVAFKPTKLTVPPPDQKAIARIKRDMAAGKDVRTKDLRRIARGEGQRLGNDRHVAEIARSIGRKGKRYRRNQPITIKEFRGGDMWTGGGNHRIRAAEMQGMKRMPVELVRTEKKKPSVTEPLYRAHKRQQTLYDARRPNPKMKKKDIKALSEKKIPAHIKWINEKWKSSHLDDRVKGRAKAVGIPAAAAAGAWYYKDDIKRGTAKLKEKVNG